MKKSANIWEHKVGINATIANFVFCENVECEGVMFTSHSLDLLVSRDPRSVKC